MERPKNPDAKNYCYRSPEECKIVKTGFHLLEMYVCKTCKEECSEIMKNRLENNETSSTGDDDLLDFWSGYPGKYP